MKLTILGTGNAYALKCYNTCFVLSDGDRHFLVDAGGGNTVISQLEKAGMSFLDIHDVFITHKHIDHILGIVWVYRMISQAMRFGTYKGECRFYTHAAVMPILKRLIADLMQKKDADMVGDRIHLITVEDGEALDIIGHEVTFFDIHSTKAPQFGFRMENVSGGPLTCCGDEPYTDVEEAYARGCKYLLHEAFCLYEEREIWTPYDFHHSTSRDAGLAAEKLGAETLIMYHTMDDDLAHRKTRYSAEAREVFSGNVLVPDDLEVIEL